MAVNILLKRSATASKRPVGASMAFGELNLNYDAATGGLYYKNSTGAVVKVGPCQVSATAPNSSPSGSAGNSAGEFWYDSATSTLKVYDGSTWQEAGGMVDSVSATGPITVDNTDPLNPIIGIDAASTTTPGAVQLNDTTSSSSTTEALTANQGRVLQQQIDALVISNNLTFAGTIDASTGNMTNVSAEGTAAGFSVGSPLPAAAAGNAEYFAIVTVEGTMTPPGGSAQLCHQGDWWLSDGSSWVFLDIGYNAPYATDTTPGVIQLATDAEVQAGTEATHAVTSSGLQSKLSDSVSTTSSTTIASSTAVKSAYDLADAAMPQTGGTFTGNVLVDNTSSLTIESGSSLVVNGTQNLVPGSVLNLNGSDVNLDATTFDVALGSTLTVDGTSSANLDGTISFGAGSTTTVDGTFTFNTAPTFPAGVDIGAAAQVTYDNASSGLAATNVQDAIDEVVAEFVPNDSFTASGDLLVGSGSGTYSALAAGPADYILASDGAGSLTWVQQSEGDVTGVTGTAPITVDNTDPQNPVVGIDAASTSAAGAVQLYDGVDSTSTTEAATANAVKIAYDEAVAAAASGDIAGIASATVIFVNSTSGDDSIGQRGTTKAFLTINAALAVALNGDTIYLSPGSFTENVTLTKGVNLIGTYNEQGMAEGTSIVGNFVYDIVNPAATSNPTLNHIRFVSPNTSNTFTVVNNSFGSGGIGTINDCSFTQAGDTSTTEFCFATSGTWTRSLYVRRATFDGNVKHAAGTAAGASGYLVLDDTLATGNAGRHYDIQTGTVEFRRPSNSISPVLHTGGTVLFTELVSGISPSNATTSSIFGGTGISYKGSAASVGAGVVYFNGYSVVTGTIDIGANLIYGWSQLSTTAAALQVNGGAIPYTTAAPASTASLTVSQSRPRYDLLTATSSVAATSQLATVVDATNGTLYSVSALDAGEF